MGAGPDWNSNDSKDWHLAANPAVVTGTADPDTQIQRVIMTIKEAGSRPVLFERVQAE